MGVAAAELRCQKCIEVNDLHRRSMAIKDRLGLNHAQVIPVIAVNGPDDMPLAIVHVEKTGTNILSCDAADFCYCSLHRLDRQMLEQIVHETIIERPVLSINLKHIADFEARIREHLPGVTDVLLAQVESRIVNQPRDAEGLNEPVVVGRAKTIRRFLWVNNQCGRKIIWNPPFDSQLRTHAFLIKIEISCLSSHYLQC